MINDTTAISVLLTMVGGLLGVLILIIGWLGNKFYMKLEEISKNLLLMAGELHSRINGIDRRLIRVEAHARVPEENHNG